MKYKLKNKREKISETKSRFFKKKINKIDKKRKFK